MFVILQFPFGDLRGFVDAGNRLQNPTWPEPSPRQYMRSMGEVKRRIGLNNWIGETRFCAADNAIKFSGNKSDFALSDDINFRLCFRRFFFDGQLAGKFEIGIQINFLKNKRTLNGNELANVLKKLFAHPVRVAGQNDGRSLPLINAGLCLAALYCVSSSADFIDENFKSDFRLVKVGSPLLFVELGKDERVTHRSMTAVAGLDETKARLSHMWLDKAKISEKEVRCWILRNPGKESSYLRELRISLLRLNASRSGLEALVYGLLNKIAVPNPRGEASDRLQKYLNKNAERCMKVPNEFKDSDLLNIAYQSEYCITASSVMVLLDTLKDEIDVRKQVFDKAKNMFNAIAELGQQNLIKAEIFMGDKYEAGQVGAQGPGAHAQNMNFNQVLSKNVNEVDLSKLVGELERLRAELVVKAKTPEHFAEIGSIASAEMEAQKGDGDKAVETLSKAGKWSLGVAEKIGLGLATAVIKTALGL